MKMKDTNSSEYIVLTLDAGGTNFVFSAIQSNKDLVDPIRYPSNAHDLDRCLSTIIEGFQEVLRKVGGKADAISFAFPGPADYENGIIGDLPNFPSFTGGVALGPMLEEQFNIPVYINNDGDLFAYGEAIAGWMPELNEKLAAVGSTKKHKNLVGITLGTGIGCGIVVDQNMLRGDNSCGAEIHNTLNKYFPNWNAEEGVSTRAIQKVYADQIGTSFDSNLMPKDIFKIAIGEKSGNKEAASEAFRQFGENLGSTIANVVTLIDGLIVLGGGITSAWDLFFPAMFKEINRPWQDYHGNQTNRLSYKVFNLQDESVFSEYAKGGSKTLRVPYSETVVKYDNMPRIGIGVSTLGASKSIALGAYAYALQKLREE
ncbi:MAG: ROK family protein [Saprospiraceae bacterium]|nr:ROK family protein [Saprospiraceae bacterium]